MQMLTLYSGLWLDKINQNFDLVMTLKVQSSVYPVSVIVDGRSQSTTNVNMCRRKTQGITEVIRNTQKYIYHILDSL